MNKNRFYIFLPVILSGVLLLGVIIGLQLGQGLPGLGFLGSGRTDKLQEVIRYVDDNYVDTVNCNALTEKAISGMLQSLDPHSVYLSVSEFRDATDPLLGKFEGIGVQFRIERDSIVVINTVSGGPSEKLGIRAGDRIVKVDGKSVASVKITNNEVLKKLKGPKGTKVKVSVFRRGFRGLIDFTITRDVIPTFSLDVAYMADPVTGYIKLGNFAATTKDEMAKALDELNGKGMKKLILDLRGNGGGYLQAAIDVADEFLPEEKLIVYTKGMHHRKEVAYATSEGRFERGPLLVLIDEFSASASEIVAGAIQDNDRGTIVGRRSFGKGLVQEQMQFKDGSAIRLTVARYYTPTGRCIQKPYTNGSDDYYNEYYHRFAGGEMENPDSIHFADSLKFKTPKGKVVYGGGGIMPDVYVPIERDTSQTYYNQLVNTGIIYQFAFDYTDKYRKTLVFKSPEEFDRGFTVTDEMFSDLKKTAEKSGIRREAVNSPGADREIRVLLKAYIGRNLLDNPAFYPYLNSIDPGYLKALAVIKKMNN